MKKFLSLLLMGSVSLGAALLYQGSSEATAPAATQKKFSRGIKGYYEYWHSLQANQTTGKVDMKDVLQARQQANAIYAQKSGSLLQWDFMGPDNVGGRTRALIVDKDNANKLVAGGVSGGLWRSDNAGANWTQITYDPNMQIIACIAQDASGDYYAGTGEGFYNGFYPGDGTQGFVGNGILKSTDGANSFSQVISTYPSDENNSIEAWGDVRAIAAHPTIDNKIYAVLGTGLRMSSDGGSTWTTVQNGTGYDVVAGSDGVIHAIIGNAYYRSDSNGDNFQSVANFSGVRKRLAVCESQPNMVYMVSVTSGGGGCLNEVQRSTDGGSTWTKIGEGTESFEPMANGAQCQGDFDLALAAHPTDGNRIFLAGVTLWSYSTSDGWRQIDNLNEDPSNPRYIHADKHHITFPKGNGKIMYVASDGGISKTTHADEIYPDFYNVNKGYNITQFYSVAAGHDGKVMGGTQDNGTNFTTFGVNSIKSTTEVHGGDGGYAEVSNIKPNILFAGNPEGVLYRSSNGGDGFAKFFDENIDCKPLNSDGGCAGDGTMDNGGGFVTPFVLWEDEMLYYTIANYQPNADNPLPHNITYNNQTFTITSNKELADQQLIDFKAAAAAESSTDKPNEEDAKYFKRIYEATQLYVYYDLSVGQVIPDYRFARSKFFTGDNGGNVWLLEDAINASYSTWRNIGKVTSGAIHELAVNNSGTTVWAGSTIGSVVRISNLNATPAVKQISSSSLFNGLRVITGLAVDPQDDARVAITAGNYGNNKYVILSTNATSTNPTFASVQSNLPFMPVYDVVIDDGTSGQNALIVASELGVWYYDPAAQNWSPQTEELGIGPVVRIRQESMARCNAGYLADLQLKCKVIYIGTHGRGMYRSTSLANPFCTQAAGSCVFDLPSFNPTTGIEEDTQSVAAIQLFPNPVRDMATLKFTLQENSRVRVNIYDINGKLVQQVSNAMTAAGTHQVEIPASHLPAGNYFVQLQTDNSASTLKMTVAR